MTENGAVTTTLLDDDDERAVQTDGCPLPGVEMRMVDDDGARCRLARPASCCCAAAPTSAAT
jgi:acyl-coenzyme A synthetase/AMP-(fatty) acid ligase